MTAFFSHRSSVFALALALVLGVLFTAGCDQASLVAPDEALSAAAANTSAAKKDKQKTFNEKFTFTDVTLSDSTITVEHGIIEAGTKDHKKDKKDFTNCSYFTEGYQESLGYYGEHVGFRSAEAVKDFCIDHFADRFQ